MNDNSYHWPDITILIAEDEMINFMLLQKVLEPTKARVLWVKNGSEAVATAISQKPDVILMDIRMPEMNGIDATRHIRKTNPDVPIVAITAFSLDNEAEQCMEAGCSGFMTKPVRPAVLYNLLDQLLFKK